ncbi:MAG: hypothetical protein AB8C02_05005 [Halioglobus sp.]
MEKSAAAQALVPQPVETAAAMKITAVTRARRSRNDATARLETTAVPATVLPTSDYAPVVDVK